MRNAPNILVAVHPKGTAEDTRFPINKTERILSMKYEDSFEKADKLVLSVDNDDLLNFDDPVWSTGNQIFIQWGYPEVMTLSRKVTITKVTGFRELHVEALGGDILLNVLKRTRPHEDLTHAGIAEKIADEWGFHDKSVRFIEPTTQLYEYVQQTNMTDAQFLRYLAAQHNFVWHIDHRGFHFHSKLFEIPGLSDSIRKITYYSDSSQTAVIDCNIDIDITTRTGSVGVATYQPVFGRGLRHNATNANQELRDELKGMLEAPGMGEWDVPGIGIVGRHETMFSKEDSLEKVKEHAEATLRAAQQNAVHMKMTIIGDPLIYAGTVIDVEGLGKRLSQRYWIAGVTHTIRNGYTCELELISGGSGGHDVTSQYFPEGTVVQANLPNHGKEYEVKYGSGIRGVPKGVINPEVGDPDTTDLQPPIDVKPPNPFDALHPGNIDLRHRPYVKFHNGKVATVRPIPVEIGGLTYLIPTIRDDGVLMTDQQAVDTFRNTGQHLGVYRDVADAARASGLIEEDQKKNPPVDSLHRVITPAAEVIDNSHVVIPQRASDGTSDANEDSQSSGSAEDATPSAGGGPVSEQVVNDGSGDQTTEGDDEEGSLDPNDDGTPEELSGQD